MTDRFARIKRFLESSGVGTDATLAGARSHFRAKDFMKSDLTGSARLYAR